MLPADVTATLVSTATMVAKLQPHTNVGSFVAHVHLVTKDGAFDATALMRDNDFRVATVLDGSTYTSGRAGGVRWRQTPEGSVRVVLSDVQSDDLDRWPSAVFGFDVSACGAAGQATIQRQLLWVLGCRSTADIPHWYYIDPASGQILSEVTLEGSHVVTYRFGDFAKRGNRMLPGTWHISGTGGDADATLAVLASATVSPEDVSIPKTVPEQFAIPPSGSLTLPATFGQYITTPVQIDGARLDFIVDTGTTQVLMDIGAAARLGLHPLLNHAIAKSIDVGGAVAHDVPIETVDLFGGSSVGILGNEFFTGHIVHIDFTHKTLELIAHDHFTPPADALEEDVNAREGMPIASATIGTVQADRCALDTGSWEMVFSDTFLRRAGANAHVTIDGASYRERYLEGPMWFASGVADSVALGEMRLTGPMRVLGESHNDENLDIPLDCILGQRFMRYFEWWFDYDTNHAWIRVAR